MATATPDRPTVHLHWNQKQTAFLRATEPYVNFEGGVRAGKTFALCFKLLYLMLEHRGICRHVGLTPVWHGDEEYDELPNGSRVYLRALKASEDTQRFAKLAGFTLAVLAIDQAEEVPEDVYRHYVPARLSQPGYPHQVLLTPNPPAEDHWIATDFPSVEASTATHRMIHTTLFDNVGPLGQTYIDEQLVGYERGTNECRRLTEGKRGVVLAGQPVYARHFDETRHVRPVEARPQTPLVEAWDYGTRHPCVIWCQFWPTGTLAILGGVMGDDQMLEEFAPVVREIRERWFPSVGTLWQTADPAGSARNPHGSRTGLDLLHDWGINPVVQDNANHPPIKDAAMQLVVGYLRRSQPNGAPCFLLNPRFLVVSRTGRQSTPVLQRMFAGGYTYDPKRNYYGTAYPHVRPPLKDGWYEHSADTLRTAE